MIDRSLLAAVAALILAAVAQPARAQSCAADGPGRTVCKMVLNQLQTVTIESGGVVYHRGRERLVARLSVDVDGVECGSRTAWVGRNVKRHVTGRCRLTLLPRTHTLTARMDAGAAEVSDLRLRAVLPDRLSDIPRQVGH